MTESTVFYEEDGDIALLKGKTIAVIGYGNQGRSQAKNLRDSGVHVIVGNKDDEAGNTARTDGFGVFDIPEAVQEAAIVMMLIPDEVMPEVFKFQVAPYLKQGAALSFASGYTIGFELIQPPDGDDVFMIAPRMIGPGVRDTYIQGSGFPSFVAVHQDATGNAESLMLAVAKGLGTLKAGALLMSMRMEAERDLFTEQAFSPAFGRVLMAAIETEIKAGYPVEAVLLELLMSGELIYCLEKIVDVGLIEQMRFHSQTSQYGTMTRSFHYLDLPLEAKMKKTLDDIRSGAFTNEWQEEQRTGMKNFHALAEVRKELPIREWQRKTRAVFRNIGKNTKKA